MKIDMLLGELLAEQSPEGAFLSIVHCMSNNYPDWNTFTTAQVLRALHDTPISTEVPGIKEAVERAINYLVLSESPERPGHFGFWPAQGCPSWMPSSLTEDADDTAIVTLELAKYGHIDIQMLRRVVFKVLMPHRLLSIEQPAPPWLRPGVFLT